MKFANTILSILLIPLMVLADSPPPVYKSTAPIVKTGTTFSIPPASSSVDGYLSSTAFTSFTNKATLPSQTGQSGKFLTTDGSTTSWGVSGGTITSVTASSPLFSSGGATPDISCQTASGSLNGCLSSIDWTTFNTKEPAITATTSAQYYRGDKTFQTLNTLVVPENTNLYYTQGRFDSAFTSKSTTNLSEGTNLYFTNARARSAISATSPLLYNSTTGVLSSQQASASLSGYLSSSDWAVFNNKLDSSRFNYILNPDAEVDASNWNLYDDSGRVASAYIVNQDITWSSVATDNTGNGINISYIFHATQPSSTPLVTVVDATHITIAWYNGPTLANNPTATQLKAAFDAVPAAVAIATCTITGTASRLQYEDGSHILANGGDTAPSDGTSGTPSATTFTRSTSSPLVGTASFLEAKGASSQIGTGVSTDFTINSADKGQILQVSFYYSGDAGMTFGSASDVKVFLYDVTNAAMLPLTRQTLTGSAGNIYRFAAQFTAASTSVLYRLIMHTTTANASAWNLKLDSVTVGSVLDATTATQVPSVVLPAQPILVSVTDHMAVMWQDGNTSWRPATMASGADASTLFGFATNIVGLTADITLRGKLNGFSFGPFAGYNQYVDSASAGSLSPAPASFTDAYVVMGKGITSDTIMVEPHVFNRLVTSKGGLLTNGGANNGTGDVVVAGGTTGQFLRYNTALTNGFAAFTPVATAPIVYTASTSTWSCAVATGSVPGCLAAADFTTFNAKAATASPTFTGTPTLPTGTIGVTQTAGNSTTALATTAFVTTADNLKANIATPTLTGDVTLSTGNLLISTIGKGPQVKTGTNGKIGTAVLVGGTVTVSNTSVTANSRIFLTSNTDGGTPGWLRVSAKTNGTSFVITSSSATDTSTVAWYMVESIP